MIKKKLRTRRGFTLTEMLCAIVVLILLSGLVAVGVRLGARALEKSVVDSEFEVLCTTLRSVVNDELRYAGSVDLTGDEIAFSSQNYGGPFSFSVNEDGQVTLGGNKLLSSKSYPYGMKATVEILSFDTSTRIFSVNVTVTSKTDELLAESAFQVKQLNKSTVIAN